MNLGHYQCGPQIWYFQTLQALNCIIKIEPLRRVPSLFNSGANRPAQVRRFLFGAISNKILTMDISKKRYRKPKLGMRMLVNDVEKIRMLRWMCDKSWSARIKKEHFGAFKG